MQNIYYVLLSIECNVELMFFNISKKKNFTNFFTVLFVTRWDEQAKDRAKAKSEKISTSPVKAFDGFQSLSTM